MVDFVFAPGVFSRQQAGATAKTSYTLENVLRLSCVSRQTVSHELSKKITLLSQLLHRYAARMTDEQVSQIMGYIATLDERREEAEQAVNSARRTGIERAGQRFAQRTDYATNTWPELV